MTAVLEWLATYAIHSTLLLGTVAALTMTVVRREAWRELLWRTALVGGILTASAQLALEIRPAAGRWEIQSAVGTAPPRAVAPLETPSVPEVGPAAPAPAPVSRAG